MSNNKNRTIGTVKWFNKKQGYGFIRALNGEYENRDIFVHFSSIRNKAIEYKYLVQGEYVEFLIEKSNNQSHEYNAVDITGIYENPILCETRSLSQDNRPVVSKEPRAPKQRIRAPVPDSAK